MGPRLIAVANRVILDYPSETARVAQLDRALASGARGCGFDPRRAYQLLAFLFPAAD